MGPHKEAAYNLGTLLPPLPRDPPSPHSAWGPSPTDPIAQRGQGSLRAPCTGCAPALEATVALSPVSPGPPPPFFSILSLRPFGYPGGREVGPGLWQEVWGQ